jgi:transposase, IS605 orfB family
MEDSKMYKGYTIRIYPTKNQEELLRKHIGCCRFIWNHMIEVQKENYKNDGKYISKFNMIKLIPSIKKENEWLNEVSSISLQRICDDVNTAYQRFFKKISNYPRFKSKKRSNLSYLVRCDRFYFENGYVKVEKVGKIKYKADYKNLNLEELSKFSNVRISNENDKWILTFSIKYENQVQITEKNGSLGIDLGVGRLAVISHNGKKLTYSNINKSKRVRKLTSKLKHVQRVISRKYEVGNKLNDKKYQKTNSILKYEKLARRIYRKISNIRKDQRHKITRELVNLNPAVVIMEDLNVKGMMKNKHLAKAISEIGFYDFIRTMKYKCEESNIKFFQVDRFFPSSKTCSHCGCVHKGLKLSDRIFECPSCGFTIDRDFNAAVNLECYFDSHIEELR